MTTATTVLTRIMHRYYNHNDCEGEETSLNDDNDNDPTHNSIPPHRTTTTTTTTPETLRRLRRTLALAFCPQSPYLRCRRTSHRTAIAAALNASALVHRSDAALYDDMALCHVYPPHFRAQFWRAAIKDIEQRITSTDEHQRQHAIMIADIFRIHLANSLFQMGASSQAVRVIHSLLQLHLIDADVHESMQDMSHQYEIYQAEQEDIGGATPRPAIDDPTEHLDYADSHATPRPAIDDPTEYPDYADRIDAPPIRSIINDLIKMHLAKMSSLTHRLKSLQDEDPERDYHDVIRSAVAQYLAVPKDFLLSEIDFVPERDRMNMVLALHGIVHDVSASTTADPRAAKAHFREACAAFIRFASFADSLSHQHHEYHERSKHPTEHYEDSSSPPSEVAIVTSGDLIAMVREVHAELNISTYPVMELIDGSIPYRAPGEWRDHTLTINGISFATPSTIDPRMDDLASRLLRYIHSDVDVITLSAWTMHNVAAICPFDARTSMVVARLLGALPAMVRHGIFITACDPSLASVDAFVERFDRLEPRILFPLLQNVIEASEHAVVHYSDAIRLSVNRPMKRSKGDQLYRRTLRMELLKSIARDENQAVVPERAEFPSAELRSAVLASPALMFVDLFVEARAATAQPPESDTTILATKHAIVELAPDVLTASPSSSPYLQWKTHAGGVHSSIPFFSRHDVVAMMRFDSHPPQRRIQFWMNAARDSKSLIASHHREVAAHLFKIHLANAFFQIGSVSRGVRIANSIPRALLKDDPALSRSVEIMNAAHRAYLRDQESLYQDLVAAIDDGGGCGAIRASIVEEFSSFADHEDLISNPWMRLRVHQSLNLQRSVARTIDDRIAKDFAAAAVDVDGTKRAVPRRVLASILGVPKDVIPAIFDPMSPQQQLNLTLALRNLGRIDDHRTDQGHAGLWRCFNHSWAAYREFLMLVKIVELSATTVHECDVIDRIKRIHAHVAAVAADEISHETTAPGEWRDHIEWRRGVLFEEPSGIDSKMRRLVRAMLRHLRDLRVDHVSLAAWIMRNFLAVCPFGVTDSIKVARLLASLPAMVKHGVFVCVGEDVDDVVFAGLCAADGTGASRLAPMVDDVLANTTIATENYQDIFVNIFHEVAQRRDTTTTPITNERPKIKRPAVLRPLEIMAPPLTSTTLPRIAAAAEVSSDRSPSPIDEWSEGSPLAARLEPLRHNYSASDAPPAFTEAGD